MWIVLLFLVELFFLFWLSRQLTSAVSAFFYRITKRKQLTIYLLAFLFLPGTFVHELSHYLMAMLLFVHAENFELMPKIGEHGVKLGSVSIESTDPFRRFLIGMAPFLFGTMIILGTLYFVVAHGLFAHTWLLGLVGYMVFEIGNTMFSSRKDMEGALELLIGLLVVGLFLYFIGFRFSTVSLDAFLGSSSVVRLFEQGCWFLAVPIVIDLLVVGGLRLLRQ